MIPQSISLTRRTLLATSFIGALVPTAARCQGSCEFDGANSKIENTDADLVVGSNDITICFWVNPDDLGESVGQVITLPESGSGGIRIGKDNSHTTLRFSSQFSSNAGAWTFPVAEDTWSAVAITYNKSLPGNNPAARVNFAAATVTPTQTASGDPPTISPGYCVGNWSNQDATFDGRLAHMQIFNRILTSEEMDACLRVPGSVKKELRLWLPMTHNRDTYDRSTNGFHGTPTALITSSDGPVLVNPPSVPVGIAYLPAATTSITQHIIPRYADGANHPAGQLRGWGPASVITGTAQTQTLNEDLRAIVITEAYNEDIGVFQGTDTQYPAAVVRPIVRDLTVAGYDHSSTGYYPDPPETGSKVSSNPARQNKKEGIITNATIHPTTGEIVIHSYDHWLPTGAQVVISEVQGINANGTWTITSSTYPYDTFTLNGSAGSGTYTGGGTWTSTYFDPLYDGLRVRGSGSQIEKVDLFAIPGTAMVVKGGGHPLWGQLLAHDAEKTRVWDCVVKRAYSGVEIGLVDTIVGRLEGFALRDFGIKFTVGASQIDGALHFYGVGAGPAVWFAAPNGTFNWGGPIYGESSKTGLWMESHGNMVHDVYSHTCWEDCVRISGERNQIHGLYVNLPATGSQPVGVRIEGQYNAITGGRIEVPASSKGIVIENGVGNRVRDLTIETASGGTGIEVVNQNLNYSVIDVNVRGGSVGVDLEEGTTGRIGTRNVIHVHSSADADPATVVDLPTGWSTTKKNTSNDIRINGVPYYPPTDEF